MRTLIGENAAAQRKRIFVRICPSTDALASKRCRRGESYCLLQFTGAGQLPAAACHHWPQSLDASIPTSNCRAPRDKSVSASSPPIDCRQWIRALLMWKMASVERSQLMYLAPAPAPAEPLHIHSGAKSKTYGEPCFDPNDSERYAFLFHCMSGAILQALLGYCRTDWQSEAASTSLPAAGNKPGLPYRNMTPYIKTSNDT